MGSSGSPGSGRGSRPRGSNHVANEQEEVPGLDNNCLTLYNFFGSADHQWPLVRHLSGGDASISQSGAVMSTMKQREE